MSANTANAGAFASVRRRFSSRYRASEAGRVELAARSVPLPTAVGQRLDGTRLKDEARQRGRHAAPVAEKRLAIAAPSEEAFRDVRDWYQAITPSQQSSVLAGLFAAGNFPVLRGLLNVTNGQVIETSDLSRAVRGFIAHHGGQPINRALEEEFVDPHIAQQVVDSFVSKVKGSPADARGVLVGASFSAAARNLFAGSAA